ncbi:MAG: hypothetical protein QNL93_10470 [Opitutae bacterium]
MSILRFRRKGGGGKPVDRHGLSALAMTRCGKESRLQFHDSTYLSLRGGRQDDAAIHCMQLTRTKSAVRLMDHSGSQRTYALAMTSVVRNGSCTHFVIARRERSRRRGNPSCLGGRRSGNAVRSPIHSGSQRASPSR